MKLGISELHLKGAGKAEIPNKKGRYQQDFSCVPLFSALIERLHVGYCNTQVMSLVLRSYLETTNLLVCTAIDFLCN